MARLSRRALVAGAGATPLLDAAARQARVTPKDDPVLLLCNHYADLQRRKEWLHRRWGDIEVWLSRHHNWFALTKAQQRALPAAHELFAVDQELEDLGVEDAHVLRRLRKVSARTIEGVTAKLSVVADVIDPEDYPSAHRALLGAISDLRGIRQR
jgi:hypothetical protein